MVCGSSTPLSDGRMTSTTPLSSHNSRYRGRPMMESRRSNQASSRRGIQFIDLEPGDSDYSSPASPTPTPILPARTRQGRGSRLSANSTLTSISWPNTSEDIHSKRSRTTADRSRQVARRSSHHRDSAELDSESGSSSTSTTEEIFDPFGIQLAREGRRKRKSPDHIEDDDQYGIQWAIQQSHRHARMSAWDVQDDQLQETGGPATRANSAAMGGSSDSNQPLELPKTSRASGASSFTADFWRSRPQSNTQPNFLRITSYLPPPPSHQRSDSLVIHVNPGTEPIITLLFLSTITTHLNSGLVQPYCTENLRRLAGWWTKGVVETYGVKQKWLLAYAVWKWWVNLWVKSSGIRP